MVTVCECFGSGWARRCFLGTESGTGWEGCIQEFTETLRREDVLRIFGESCLLGFQRCPWEWGRVRWVQKPRQDLGPGEGLPRETEHEPHTRL